MSESDDDYWYVPTPTRAEMRAAWPRKRLGRMLIREMPSREAILEDHWLCRERWRFFVRLGVRHPLDWVHPMGRFTPDGYRSVHMLGFSWPEHRLIWKVVTGQEPKGYIDHINGVRDDNRFENLRDVSPQGNALNSVPGRWAAEAASRAVVAAAIRETEKKSKREAKERRERATLAKLKAKYEN